MKPCPFCGSDQIEEDKPDDYVVWCGNCGAFGPNDVSEAKAREMWNLRRPMDKVLAACEAAEPLLDLARARLAASTLEEPGYCPACSAEELCYNHQQQGRLIAVIKQIRTAIAQVQRNY